MSKKHVLNTGRFFSEIVKSLPDIIGASAAIITSDGRLWTGTAGFSDPQKTKPIAPDVQYPIFSVTKTFIATLALMLERVGKINITDSIEKWFPHIPNAGTITLEHLLNHTSGIPNYTATDAYHEAVRKRPSVPWSFDDILQSALSLPPMFTPGTGWFYSNTNYWIIGEIIQKFAPVADLLQEKIFSPLALEQSYYPAYEFPRYTNGYSDYFGDERDVSPIYHTGWAGPAGAIVSTPSDSAVFLHTLFSDALLSESLNKRMRKAIPVPGNHPDGFYPHYGLGIQYEKATPFGDIYGHGGMGPGFAALAQHLPEYGITGMVISNSDRKGVEDLLYPLLKHVIDNGV